MQRLPPVCFFGAGEAAYRPSCVLACASRAAAFGVDVRRRASKRLQPCRAWALSSVQGATVLLCPAAHLAARSVVQPACASGQVLGGTFGNVSVVIWRLFRRGA